MSSESLTGRAGKRGPVPTRSEAQQLLTRLHQEQFQKTGDGLMVHRLRNPTVVLRHIDAYRLYAPFIADCHSILDWGCRQAIDSCLIRLERENGVELRGCDTGQTRYETFHQHARMAYDALEHPYRLPYPDGSFDAVIGSGVLEHVPFELESIKEIYRVLRAEGRLIITFLPNRWSYTEWIGRRIGASTHHRTYSRRGIERLLIRNGFLPLRSGYHQVLPALGSGHAIGENRFVQLLVNRAYSWNGLAERLRPIRWLAANLYVIAEKRPYF